jgi:tRNA(Ser,Leu) C12 N-acetylase TAN1
MADEVLAKALTPDIPGLGKTGKQLLAAQKPITEGKETLSKELSGTEQRILEGQQRVKEEEAQGAVAAGEQYGKSRAAAQEKMQTQLAEAPIEPFIPTKDTAQDIAGLFGLIGVIGMLVGKSNAQQAMGAMNGMLEGHRKGRADLYKQERDTYDKNFKALLKKHDEIRSEFKDALDTLSTDKELGLQKAHLAAVKSESPIIQELVRKGEITRASSLYDDTKRDIQKLVELDQKERQHAETLASQERLRKATLAAKSEAANTDLGSYIKKFTGSTVNKKDAPEIMTAANAVGDAYAIKQSVAEHPEWVGRTGQIKNFFNRTIESINAGEPPPSDEGQPELVFAKRYAEYLVNYERALAGGARGFTVQFQKRFNALLDQNQFNATGMDNLMNEQIRTIASKAAEKSPTINRQNLTQMAYDLKTRAEDETAVKGMAASFGQEPTQSAPKGKPMPTGDKMKAYADTHFQGDEAKAKEYLRTQGYQ